MDKDRDLLPWILGGLSMASVALAVAVAASNRTPPGLAAAPNPPTALALPAVALASAAALPAPPQSSAVPEPLPMPAAAPAIPTTGQIWECTTNGQKTFSNNPCGDKSSLLDLGPINTMDRAPVYRTARAYPPGPDYSPGYSDPDSQDSADNGYPSMVAVPVFVQRNTPRTHRPFNREHSPAPRKY